MQHITHRKIISATALSLLPVLAGCQIQDGSQVIDSTSNYTFATLPANTALDLTAHQGLEAATVTKSAAGGTVLTAVATPTATAMTTTDGFSLTLPDNTAVDYSAASGHSNLIATQTYSATANNNTNTVETTLTNGAASPLSYATYGVWVEKDKTANLMSVGAIAMGIPTAVSQMPATGSANYSGNISGFVSNTSTAAKITGGTVALIANFTDKTINGTVTNIATQNMDTGAAGQINNIFLNAGKITDNTFAGTAAVAAASVATTMDISAANTGAFGGRFYGPSAAEAAGSLSLTGGGNTLLASFGTKK